MNQINQSKIAVVIITKDEERNIAACLESVQWADERIVVDSTVDFDSKLGLMTVEVEDEASQGMLAAELVAKLPITKPGPQDDFARRHVRAQGSGGRHVVPMESLIIHARTIRTSVVPE